LSTFSTFYTAWVARLTTDLPRSERTAQGLFLRLILYTAVTVSVFVATWSGIRSFTHLLPEILPRQNTILPWAGAALITLPFLFLISSTLERLMQNASMVLLRRADEPAGQNQLVRATLRFLLGWVAAVFVLALGAPVLPPLVPLGIVGFGLLVTTYFFWESLTRFHARVENVLSSLTGDSTAGSEAGGQQERSQRLAVTQLLRDRYGLSVRTEDFVVPFHPTALNQSIRTLNLRSLTGASIIAIHRDPEQIIVPQSEAVLLPGDVLALLGEKDQLEAAIRLLTTLAAQKATETTTQPQIVTVAVSPRSPFVGCTLAELRVREELGVLVVGVRRGTEQITNPGPDFQVEAGDTLYLWGSPEQVAVARQRAA
jgi:CPA2 family monovalent cation:H+ antiporter-2